MNKEMSLLGVSSGLGQKKLGLELAPSKLRSTDFFQTRLKSILDYGDINLTKKNQENCWGIIAKIRSTLDGQIDKSKIHLTLGGDHSISIGTIQSTLVNYPKARVIWIDAHGDMNTPETSLSGNLHGMPLAALIGLFDTPNTGPSLPTENLLMIGTRDLDPAEKMILEQLKIMVITSDQLMKNFPASLDKIINWINIDKINPIHLSFDIDVIDPRTAPATGTQVPNGIDLEKTLSILNTIKQTDLLISVDFVEFNPLCISSKLDYNKTIQTCQEILEAIFN